MLRKLLLTLSLVFLIQIPVFGYTDSGFESGECDYRRYGMRCGVGGCASNERCVWQNTFDYNGSTYNNPYTSASGAEVYVGRCVPYGSNSVAPCSSVQSTNSFSFDESCNTICPTGQRAEKLFTMIPTGPLVGLITGCFTSSVPCYAFTSGGPSSVFYQCVADPSCNSLSAGCNYNAPAGQSGCLSGESCWETPIYDAAGNQTGSIGSCVLDPQGQNQCTLPSGYDYYCSTNTGCNLGSYCKNGGSALLGGYDTCIDVNPSIPTPGTCFASTGSTCGKNVSTSDSGIPTGWTETLYCKQGDSCASYNASTGFLQLASAYSYYNYPDSGTCITCAADKNNCTGASQLANGAIDDCCDPNMKCGADKKCRPISQPSFCSGQIPNPGSICKAYGSTEDYCDLCPVSMDGSSTITNANGDIYCKSPVLGTGSQTGQVLSSCSSDCGCPNGYNCNNGSCVAESSCVSPGNTCSTSGAPCCNPSDVSYTCTYDSEARQNICQSPECKQVEQTLQCTEATESCCPDNKPFCNNGTCGEVFECTSEGECCPGYGMVCDANKQCVPSTDGECETEDNVLPPAPAYLGPQIEIPQLFSAIGAILYPAGIGIGLLFILRAGYIIMMSEGSPDEVKKGQEYLTSAVIGTLFIVLSGSILRIIINALLG